MAYQKKKIVQKDLKYAEKSWDLDDIVTEVNAGGSRGEQAVWILDPRSMSSFQDSPRRKAMMELIYSIAKSMNTTNAEDILQGVADKLDTSPSFIERWMRGDNRFQVHTKWGQNYLGIDESDT